MDSEQGALRFESVCRFFDLPKSTMHLIVARPDFPKPMKLGERSKLWMRDDLVAWMRQQVLAGTTYDPDGDGGHEPRGRQPANDDEPTHRARRRGSRAVRVRKVPRD